MSDYFFAMTSALVWAGLKGKVTPGTAVDLWQSIADEENQ